MKTRKENYVETIVVHHFIDGREEDAKEFVEIEGEKFIVDPTDPTKAKLGDDGKPLKFEEKKAVETPTKKSIEELAKDNPELAEILKKQAELEKAEADRKAKEQKEADEKKLAEGKFQELIADKERTIAELTGQITQKDEILGKYVGSVKEILEKVKATIPKEKLALIPADFKARRQLEYIVANAEFLGADVTFKKGDKVVVNDPNINRTEEGKIIAEMEELQKKGAAMTKAEGNLLWEKSVALKKLREANAKK